MYNLMPELTDEEKKLPLAKYYYKYPLLPPNPLQQQIIDQGPMDPKDAFSADHWLDLLQPEGYQKVEYGYCMMPDGSGYYAEYFVEPDTITPEMNQWFMNFINHHSKSMVEGQGNLRYKLWCPPDHWDHGYNNGVDSSDGSWATGTLDLGQTGAKNGTYEESHPVDLFQCGFTRERADAMRAAGCTFGASYENVAGPGHHLVLRMSRPCPFGGTEHMNHEWLGYYVQDGKIIRDENTPVSEEILKNILLHNTMEHSHRTRWLSELYAEYKDQPIDAD